MCNDIMKVDIQSQLVKRREAIKVNHNKDQQRKYSTGMCNDTMKVGIQSQSVKGKEAFRGGLLN